MRLLCPGSGKRLFPFKAWHLSRQHFPCCPVAVAGVFLAGEVWFAPPQQGWAGDWARCHHMFTRRLAPRCVTEGPRLLTLFCTQQNSKLLWRCCKKPEAYEWAIRPHMDHETLPWPARLWPFDEGAVWAGMLQPPPGYLPHQPHSSPTPRQCQPDLPHELALLPNPWLTGNKLTSHVFFHSPDTSALSRAKFFRISEVKNKKRNKTTVLMLEPIY